jgi:hypothetical protein
MRRFVSGGLALLLLGPALLAQEKPKEAQKTIKAIPLIPPAGAQDSNQKTDDKPAKTDTPKTPGDAFKAVLAEYTSAYADFLKEYRAVKTQEERNKIVTEKLPKPAKYAGRMMELVQKNPKDAFVPEALTWIANNASNAPEGQKALAMLLKDFLDTKHIGPIVRSLPYSGSPDAEKNLRLIMEKNPDHEIQGTACLSLVTLLKNKNRGNSAPADGDKTTVEIESLLNRIIEKYDDVKYGRKTLGSFAKGELFEMKNLAIGKVAPEIEGEDIDGKKFKLSDYRGKVILIDFWGHW